MSTAPTSGQRQRTCRACGKKFDYPVKGSAATRHHCTMGNVVELSGVSVTLPE